MEFYVSQVNETEYTSLMYEVLADQTMWAVLGRTAGNIYYCIPKIAKLQQYYTHISFFHG